MCKCIVSLPHLDKGAVGSTVSLVFMFNVNIQLDNS